MHVSHTAPPWPLVLSLMQCLRTVLCKHSHMMPNLRMVTLDNLGKIILCCTTSLIGMRLYDGPLLGDDLLRFSSACRAA